MQSIPSGDMPPPPPLEKLESNRHISLASTYQQLKYYGNSRGGGGGQRQHPGKVAILEADC